MAQRGKAQFGDKTILDVLAAASKAGESLSDAKSLTVATDNRVDATLQHVRSLPCRQGRARVLSEKGVGRRDGSWDGGIQTHH
jgi:dihydroxyacetone kinase-like protein